MKNLYFDYLFHAIIESKILIIKKNNFISNKDSNYSFKQKYALAKIVYFLKAIKQFLRVIQFFIKFYKKNGMLVRLGTDFYLELIDILCKNSGVSRKTFIIRQKSEKITYNSSKLYLHLEKSTDFIKKDIKGLNYKKIYLILLFNPFLDHVQSGIYQLNIQLGKFISNFFLLILIFNIIIVNRKSIKK